eukprot:751202-Hanusia_phi.AAC.4
MMYEVRYILVFLLVDGFRIDAYAGYSSNTSSNCGDGILQPFEHCDDNNTASGDGCSTLCKVETGWVCKGAPSICCGPCNDGYFRDNCFLQERSGNSAGTCTPCPSGHYLPAGMSYSSRCMPCNNGSWSAEGATQCSEIQPCETGLYRIDYNSSSPGRCVSCPRNMHKPFVGSWSSECVKDDNQPSTQVSQTCETSCDSIIITALLNTTLEDFVPMQGSVTQTFMDLISSSGVLVERLKMDSFKSEPKSGYTNLIYRTKTNDAETLIATLKVEPLNYRLTENNLPHVFKLDIEVRSASSVKTMSPTITLVIVSVVVLLLLIVAFTLMTMTNRRNEPVQPMNSLGDIEKCVQYNSKGLPPLNSTYVSFSVESEDKKSLEKIKKQFQIYVTTEQVAENCDFIHPTQGIHSSSLLLSSPTQPVALILSRV